MSITITVSGSGGAFGVGSISEDQYEYWIDREEDVVSAFQQDLDQSDVPENAQIDNHYDSYDDIGSVYGLYEDDVMIKITDSSDNVLFEGGYEDYFEFEIKRSCGVVCSIYGTRFRIFCLLAQLSRW